MRLAGAVLVDPLEALCVLNGHQELLSQVFKWLVGRQIQAVETEKRKKNPQKNR